MNTITKKRDPRFDALRGLAITLVVLGHILQAGYVGYENTLIFRVIWSLQMPLFVVVSGFFAGDGRLSHIPKRARTYLIPFVSCFLLKMLVFAHRLDIVRWLSELPFNMENSLWYLFVLFVLCTTHIFALALANKIEKDEKNAKNCVLYTLFFGIFLIPEALLCLFISSSFLAVKLVLYYAVFFWCGRMWRVLTERLPSAPDAVQNRIRAVADALCIAVGIAYLWFISHKDIYGLGEGIRDIAFRMLISMLGVYLVIKAVFATYRAESRTWRFFSHIGKYTLEIYYLHYLCIFQALRYLVPLTGKITAPVFSVEGLVALVLYYFVLLALSFILMTLINSSPYLSFIVFGKGLPKKIAAPAEKFVPGSPRTESEPTNN